MTIVDSVLNEDITSLLTSYFPSNNIIYAFPIQAHALHSVHSPDDAAFSTIVRDSAEIIEGAVRNGTGRVPRVLWNID